MANCIKCGKYTKYENGLCPSCYHKNKKSNEEEIEQKPFLVQLTEFIDVVGKHGIGVTMVGMGLLFVLFMHPNTNSWQNIIAYIVAIPSIMFGTYIEYIKIKIEIKGK